MAAAITIADVREFTGTDLPDSIVQAYIDVIDEADACLDSYGVPTSKQTLLKLNGAGHLIASSQAATGVESMTGPLGDSIKYKADASGIDRTSYGQQLKMLDKTGCVTSLFSDYSIMFEVL
jgi:hypothetical protein